MSTTLPTKYSYRDPPPQYASAGDDRIYCADTADLIYADGFAPDPAAAPGANYLWLAGGDDYAYGGLGSDTVFGCTGNDTLYGYSWGGVGIGLAGIEAAASADRADLLFGGAGNDLIISGGGADILSGGDGNDRLHGGAGGDALTGGAGEDAFFYERGDSPAGERDIILDFRPGEDVMDLRGLSGFGATPGRFIGAAAFDPAGGLQARAETAGNLTLLQIFVPADTTAATVEIHMLGAPALRVADLVWA